MIKSSRLTMYLEDFGDMYSEIIPYTTDLSPDRIIATAIHDINGLVSEISDYLLRGTDIDAAAYSNLLSDVVSETTHDDSIRDISRVCNNILVSIIDELHNYDTLGQSRIALISYKDRHNRWTVTITLITDTMRERVNHMDLIDMMYTAVGV